MAFLIEQAGGRASNGYMPILDIVPRHIHERTPVFLGSPEDVADLEAVYRAYPEPSQQQQQQQQQPRPKL